MNRVQNTRVKTVIYTHKIPAAQERLIQLIHQAEKVVLRVVFSPSTAVNKHNCVRVCGIIAVILDNLERMVSIASSYSGTNHLAPF